VLHLWEVNQRLNKSRLSNALVTAQCCRTSSEFPNDPVISAGLVGGLWSSSQKRRLTILSAAVRHSLSIYLGQSLVFALFSAWGFKMSHEISLLGVVLLATATWLGLAVLAELNLKFRSRGPMEALLSNFSKLFERK